MSETKNNQAPEVIDTEELNKSIQHQQNLKKGGPDDTTNECFKNLPEHMLTKLLSILNACIQLACTPYSWQISLTMLIYKKGNALEIKTTDQFTIFKIWGKNTPQQNVHSS